MCLMDQYLGAANSIKDIILLTVFVTLLRRNCSMQACPLKVLKELMGHHSIQITLRYTQLYDATQTAPVRASDDENYPAAGYQWEVSMEPLEA